MLIEPLKARDLKVELFQQGSIEALQDELQAWFDSREEEVIVGISFEHALGDLGAESIGTVPDSYIAHVLYTE